MFGFFKSKTKVPPPVVVEVPATERDSAPPHLRNEMQKELIRMVLREALRFHGIPMDWIRSAVRRVQGSSGQEVTQIHLVYMHWNEQLLRYSAVLEKKILSRLAQYEPGQQPSRFEVVWRYHDKCNCPHIDMPVENVWEPEPVAVKEKPFFLHDSGHIANPERDFAPTNILPLRK